MANEQKTPPDGEAIITGSADAGITWETAPRHMKFVRVTYDDLDQLKNSNSTLELAFFGICFGALVSVWTTTATIDLTDPAIKATFVGLKIMLLLATVYFGIAAARGEYRWRRKIKELKGQETQ